jgi:hypothetical protein
VSRRWREIRSDPKLALWAHYVKITPRLCDEALPKARPWSYPLDGGAVGCHSARDRGNSFPHAAISELFRRNIVDAEVWYQSHRLYFDYKAGRLTRTDLGRRIADMKSRFDPTAGTDLIRRTFDRMIEEWGRVYDGNLIRRSMEGKYHNPNGEPFLPGLKPESPK